MTTQTWTQTPIITRLKIGNDVDTYMPVYLKAEDRPLNVFEAGKPGTGKSVNVINWYHMDTLFGCARVVIDPSGSMAKQLYAIAQGKTIYCSLEHPFPLNLLHEPYDPIQLINSLIEVINQVVTITTPNEKFTVKMRQILTDVGLWCIEKEGRKSVEAIRDVLKSQKGNTETRDGIIARLELLLQNPKMKQIICGDGMIDWVEFIENGRSLILDCWGMSKDEMVFTGTLITNSIKSYFRYRKVKEYKPLIITVDEAHNFINPGWLDITKEGRKYNLCAILATQDFQNMDDRLIKTILSNFGTLIAFNCGYREASALSNEFQDLDASTIQFLEKYHCAYRTPEAEGIAKSQRPLLIKEIPIKSMKREPRTFDLKWFTLEPYQPDNDSEHSSGGFR